MKEKIKIIRELVGGLIDSISQKEETKNLTHEECEKVVKKLLFKEDYRVFELGPCSREFNIDREIVRNILRKLLLIARHPIRLKKSICINNILESLVDENNIVTFETLRDKIAEDYEYFIIAFNIYSNYRYSNFYIKYEYTEDKSGLRKLELADIAKKIINFNTKNQFTPEAVFAEYVEFYQGCDIEIDGLVFSEIISRFHKDSSGVVYKNMELDIYKCLTTKESEYFYVELNYVFNKLLKIITNETTLCILKELI